MNPHPVSGFQKGNKLGGRTPMPPEFKELAAKNTIPALQRIIDISKNPKEDSRIILEACKMIIEIVYGKPKGDLGDNLKEMVKILFGTDNETNNKVPEDTECNK
jgi:hypothetical protein